MTEQKSTVDSLVPTASGCWQFQREQFLEDFVYQHLEVLLNLKALSRQQIMNQQVCDILAVNQQGQLTIVELKNREDRYVVQQLTRYYSAMQIERPYLEQIDYSLPVRLIAVLPSIHSHNRIDQTYSRLNVELYSFKIVPNGAALQFELSAEAEELSRVMIPPAFHQYLIQEGSAVIISLPPPPPRSLRKLIEPLSLEQQAVLLDIRAQLLASDPNIGEVGRTVTTQYGLKKGEREVYQSRLLAEFSPWRTGTSVPRLCLRLPYPRRQMGGAGRTMKSDSVMGLVWAVIKLESDWKLDAEIEQLALYSGKLSGRPSQYLSLEQYEARYRQLMNQEREFHRLQDLLNAAIETWQLTGRS